MSNIILGVRDPASASGALLHKEKLSSVKSMSYTLNNNSKWIYCNYPEKIAEAHLAEKGYCLNQVKITESGTAQIFYSYNTQKLSSAIKFGIQIFNPNKSAVTFKKMYVGHSDSEESNGWTNCIFNTWKRFFKSSSSSTSIASNGVYWCLDEEISTGRIFTGSLRFNVTGPVIVTVYAYRSRTAIDGNAVPYPYDSSLGKQYSGYGNGYFYTASPITIKASELKNGSIGFKTNYPNGINVTVNGNSKTTDLIPITLASPASKTVSAENGDNLGNWGVQYAITLKLQNDTSSDVTFRGYIRTDTESEDWPIVVSGGAAYGAKLNTASSNDKNAWNWFEQKVKAGTTDTATYQWILGTNSCHMFSHIFDLK